MALDGAELHSLSDAFRSLKVRQTENKTPDRKKKRKPRMTSPDEKKRLVHGGMMFFRMAPRSTERQNLLERLEKSMKGWSKKRIYNYFYNHQRELRDQQPVIESSPESSESDTDEEEEVNVYVAYKGKIRIIEAYASETILDVLSCLRVEKAVKVQLRKQNVPIERSLKGLQTSAEHPLRLLMQ